MQSSYSSSRILRPVNGGFILLSLFFALLLNFLPTSTWSWVPDWLVLLLVFWAIREPRYVGMGMGFLLGLVMDVADASLLGQHALAYVVLIYLANTLSRRILWFPVGQQSLHVLPLLLLSQIIQFTVRFMSGVEWPGLIYFVGPFIGATLWWPVTFILLLPQYRPIEHDANRPI